MRTLVLTAACLLGIVPSLSLGEVCVRGSSVPMVGLPPLLHGCGVLFSFDDSFGVGGLFPSRYPIFAASSAGRPQVGVWFEFNDLVDVLEVGSQSTGKSFDEATSEFESALRKVACGGAYDDFLKAGGSLRVTLTAHREKVVADPLDLSVEQFALIDFEIDTPKDCEAP